jgi:hypothetical protein
MKPGMGVRPKVALYWLLVTLSFSLTQPGAVAFANWDAPYGFYKDLSTWMECSGAFLTLVLAYGIHLWRKNELSTFHIITTAFLAIGTFWLGYWAEGFLRGEMGYGTGGPISFIVGGFIALILSLILLPMTLPYALAGGLYYPYDRPLIIAWAISVAVSIVLLLAYMKGRRGIRGLDNQAP